MLACNEFRYSLPYLFLYILCGFAKGPRYLLYRVLPLHSLASSVPFLHEKRLEMQEELAVHFLQWAS